MGIEFEKPVVLVVDDERDICEMFIKILYEDGYLTDMAKKWKRGNKKKCWMRDWTSYYWIL